MRLAEGYRILQNPETKKNLGEYSISRVIGLPGEKVKIDKGQIFINGKLLDTFTEEHIDWVLISKV